MPGQKDKNLIDLGKDFLLHTFSFLNRRDLARLNQTSKTMRELASNEDTIKNAKYPIDYTQSIKNVMSVKEDGWNIKGLCRTDSFIAVAFSDDNPLDKKSKVNFYKYNEKSNLINLNSSITLDENIECMGSSPIEPNTVFTITNQNELQTYQVNSDSGKFEIKNSFLLDVSGSPSIPISTLSCLPNGDLLAYQHNNLDVFRKNKETNTYQRIETLISGDKYTSLAAPISLGPNNNFITQADNNDQLIVWHYDNNEQSYTEVARLGSEDAPLKFARFFPDGRILVTNAYANNFSTFTWDSTRSTYIPTVLQPTWEGLPAEVIFLKTLDNNNFIYRSIMGLYLVHMNEQNELIQTTLNQKMQTECTSADCLTFETGRIIYPEQSEDYMSSGFDEINIRSFPFLEEKLGLENTERAKPK